MNTLSKKIINSLSFFKYDIKKHYKLRRTLERKLFSVKNKSYLDTFVFCTTHNVRVRIFFPTIETTKAILYIHGGGWATGDINMYSDFCLKLTTTDSIVILVDYSLSPDVKYPVAINECIDIIKFIKETSFLNIDFNKLTLMGDSAGGNMVASINLLARDKKFFKINKQVLIYPLLQCDHSKTTKFKSVLENDNKWGLNSKSITSYLELYTSKENLNNKYINILNETNYKEQPISLIITAQYDILRDEGKLYGKKLKEHTSVLIECIDNTHGFLTSPLANKENKQCIEMIKNFLEQ